MKEFKVNEYITLKLKREETFIYVKGEKFLQCKYLLLNIPVEDISIFEEIKSIDEAAELLDKSLEPELNSRQQLQRGDKIPPEIAFWGHCSNLQVWAEANYDTRLLHTNLAFPLHKKLSDVGDPTAKKAVKEEIAIRIIEGDILNVRALLFYGYLDYLTQEELATIFSSTNFQLFDKIYNILTNSIEVDFDLFSEADALHIALGKYMVKPIKEKLINSFIQKNFEDFVSLMKLINALEDSDLNYFINGKKLNFIQNIVKIFSYNKVEFSDLSSRLFKVINRLASFNIKSQLQEIIRKENPAEIKTAIELDLFHHLNDKDIKEIVENLYEPLLMSLIVIEEAGEYGDAYIFSLEKLEKEIYKFTSENYSLISSQLKRIITKSLKKNYIEGLVNYFDEYSSLGNIIKKKDYIFYDLIQTKLKA